MAPACKVRDELRSPLSLDARGEDDPPTTQVFASRLKQGSQYSEKRTGHISMTWVRDRMDVEGSINDFPSHCFGQSFDIGQRGRTLQVL
jgi:hypothetical protein